jgi:fructose-1,6-bisphosphatase/inositol monophosphatase family enzyme
MLDLQRTTEIALEIAQEAGELALGYYRQVQAHRKSDGSLVTRADREAEELIRRRLGEAFPDHAIVGEEFGRTGDPQAEYVWYLDPVDGTSNFFYGLPLWGVSMGLTHHDIPVVGVLNMPASRDLYWAWEGGGAYLNGQRLVLEDHGETRTNDLLSISSLSMDRYEFTFRQKMRCLGSAAHALAGVAAGHFVAMVQDNWHLYDFAAALVLASELGLTVTDLQGVPFRSFAGLDARDVGPTLLAAWPSLHAGLLETVHPRS